MVNNDRNVMWFNGFFLLYIFFLEIICIIVKIFIFCMSYFVYFFQECFIFFCKINIDVFFYCIITLLMFMKKAVFAHMCCVRNKFVINAITVYINRCRMIKCFVVMLILLFLFDRLNPQHFCQGTLFLTFWYFILSLSGLFCIEILCYNNSRI